MFESTAAHANLTFACRRSASTAAAVVAVVALLAVLLVACQSAPAVNDGDFPARPETPDPRKNAAEAYWLLVEAIESNRANAVWFLLEHTIRDAMPYGTFADAWPEIQPRLQHLFVANPPVDEPVSLGRDPRPDDWTPAGGASIRIELADPDHPGETVATLWVLERDSTRWPGELRPRWRLVYPCLLPGYQFVDDNALAPAGIDWDELLPGDRSGDGDGGDGGDGSGSVGDGDGSGNSGDGSSDGDGDGYYVPPGFD